MSATGADFVVIGAGIAGASAAAELAAEARVILLEAEAQPGYHTTGRSAAMFAPSYGPGPVRALTRASEGFYNAPPEGFAEHPVLSPRDTLFVAREDQLGALDALETELGAAAGLERLGPEALVRHQPLLRPGYAAAGLIDRSGADIDVAALHQGYLRQLRQRGGTLVTGARVTGLTRQGGCWQVETGKGALEAPVVVNAAGAWADELGALAGAEPIGLEPRRRTAMIVAAPAGLATDPLPLTVCAEESFYLKPDAGRLLISPANEDPEPPGDSQPDELDMAICVDRITRAFALEVRRIESRWAGLRSFVADKVPVAGFSERAEGFFWLAGQGGYGIQTAPALARVAAALALGQPVPADIAAEGLDAAALSPARLGG